MKAALGFILLVSGCMYQVGTLHRTPAVAVPMFDNHTERRDHEFELTRQVIRELSRQGIHVDPSADWELRGEIVDIQQPVLVDDRLDNPRVSSFVMKVVYKVVDRRDPSKVVFEGQATESAAFSALRGQGAESARLEVLDRLSKSIVSKFQRGW